MKFLSPDEGGGEGGAGGESIAGTGGEMSRAQLRFEPIPKTTTGDKEPPTTKHETSTPKVWTLNAES